MNSIKVANELVRLAKILVASQNNAVQNDWKPIWNQLKNSEENKNTIGFEHIYKGKEHNWYITDLITDKYVWIFKYASNPYSVVRGRDKSTLKTFDDFQKAVDYAFTLLQ